VQSCDNENLSLGTLPPVTKVQLPQQLPETGNEVPDQGSILQNFRQKTLRINFHPRILDFCIY
jgi:hypothetical protein